VVSLAFMAGGTAAAQTPEYDEHPIVVSERTKTPAKRVVNKVRFRPTDNPSVAQTKRIAHAEQDRFGGPLLIDRIRCESMFRPKVVNSIGAGGLLQFLPSTWNAFAPGTPRDVRDRDKRRVWKPVLLIREWSNGITTRDRTGERVRQKRVRIRKGKLPSSPSRLHGWAAIRVGQIHWNDTAWDCGV
jgi:hypothetical protein